MSMDFLCRQLVILNLKLVKSFPSQLVLFFVNDSNKNFKKSSSEKFSKLKCQEKVKIWLNCSIFSIKSIDFTIICIQKSFFPQNVQVKNLNFSNSLYRNFFDFKTFNL